MCASDRRWPAVLAVALLTAATAQAQQAPSRDQEMIRRLRQQVQQLQQEQAAQQQAAQKAGAEKAQASQQLEAAQGELGRVRAGVATQTRRAAQAEQEAQALRAERDKALADLQALQARLTSTEQALQQTRTESTERQRQLTTRTTDFANLAERHRVQAEGLQTCVAANKSLRDIGFELLDRYANKGPGEILAQAEPFLQTRRVALENLLQGYEDKLDAQAAKVAAAAAEAARAGADYVGGGRGAR